MEVRGHPGLYVFGELLDFTGPIGGLNFQAAFATANLAARHAARIVEERIEAEPGTP
jgi:predicted flavoprotein YhiN